MTRNRFYQATITLLAASLASASNAFAQASLALEKKVHRKGPKPPRTPLFNGGVSYGNLVLSLAKELTSKETSKHTPIMSCAKSRTNSSMPARRWKKYSSAMST